ncbi:MAG: PmoA family protein [Planctomycetota bacterium]
MKRLALYLPALAVASCSIPVLSSSPDAPPGLSFEGREGRIAVLQDGELFTEYRYEGLAKPCLYPLYAPGGVPVTRGWPIEEREGEEHDHPHHLSLWVAHGAVNGHDFWTGENTEIQNAESIVCSSGRDCATLFSRNKWIAGEDLVLVETRSMKFTIESDLHILDFDITLSPADGPVTFGDTKEGTFGLRMHPALRLRGESAQGSALNSEGVEGKDVWGKRARWIAYGGPVEGEEVTIALLDHPKNPRHPTWWHARDYGLVAANPFGIHDFERKPAGTGDLTVASSDKLRLRYRVLLMEGAIDADDIDDAWEEYADG